LDCDGGVFSKWCAGAGGGDLLLALVQPWNPKRKTVAGCGVVVG
jgi:hypothetical protein